MRKDIDCFGAETPIPPMCLVSVYPLNAPDTAGTTLWCIT